MMFGLHHSFEMHTGLCTCTTPDEGRFLEQIPGSSPEQRMRPGWPATSCDGSRPGSASERQARSCNS